MISSPQKTPSTRRRWRRRLIKVIIAVVVPVILVPSGLGVMTTYLLLHPGCGESAATPRDFGHDYEDVTLNARAGGSFRAFFIPGENGAAIIIPPTGSAGRGSRLRVADIYARHGYAVLTFVSRRCAGIEPYSLGYREVNEVGDALDFLLARDDIDPNRIGIAGFSSAGAASVMAAARFPQIRAVIAEGGYGDFAEGALDLGTGGPLEWIYKEAMAISYRVMAGVDIHKLSPLTVIGNIEPRPILLIYGTEEHSLGGAYKQLDAAGETAELWVVQGADHGGYLDVASMEYEQRVIAFFDRALLSGEE
jgi:pimeloyl-ACP methyl ester carboxylesterase